MVGLKKWAIGEKGGGRQEKEKGEWGEETDKSATAGSSVSLPYKKTRWKEGGREEGRPPLLSG